ncbi:MAG: hypothetical protein ACWGQW_04255 [bacterium]
MATITVLNDGETYTDARGCMVTEVPDELLESDFPTVEEFLDADEDEPLFFIHDFYGQTVIELTELGRQRVIIR